MAVDDPTQLAVIEESPAKRRKTSQPSSTPHPTTATQKNYNSEDDSGDDVFDGYDTVATLPLAKATGTQLETTQLLLSSSPANYKTTQPTQILDRTRPPTSGPTSHTTQPTQILDHARPPTGHPYHTPKDLSVVQVAASSPLRPAPAPSASLIVRPTANKGVLASAIAPAGTSYRPPPRATRPAPKAAVIDLSDDDGPTYKGHSSDDDLSMLSKADIKTSTFVRSTNGALAGDTAQTSSARGGQARVGNRFKDIMDKSVYTPSGEHRNAKSSSLNGNAGNLDKDVAAAGQGTKQRKQLRPDRAKRVHDIPLSDITNPKTRDSIFIMRNVLPSATVIACRDALAATRGDYERAVELILSQEDFSAVVDITGSEDELSKPARPAPAAAAASSSLSSSSSKATARAAPSKAPAKRELKAPNRTIQDKWSTTQLPKPPQKRPSVEPVETPPKPKRRLVQGRREPSSPIEEVVSTGPLKDATPGNSDDSDSAIASSDVDESALEKRVLEFFNTCSVQDLADISNNTEKTASLVVSHRPFSSLDEVRGISAEVETTTKAGKRRTTRKTIGDKIVDVCLDMWTGYEAVDDLVTKCEALGAPVAEEMKKWGVDVFGAAKAGELNLVCFENGDANGSRSLCDSGIGSSPAPPNLELDDDDVKDSSKRRTNRPKPTDFIGQPTIMGEDVALKDYQLVGLNWLALLYKNRLSCILADEMGLGKTCQVIAFLAHLTQTGVAGTHLVVVPGSTLENWLREFRRFCPSLVVEPYYGLEKERAEMRMHLEENIERINVVVTTYDLASKKLDGKFLRQLKPVVCVYDEGHALKNSTSKRYEALMRIPATFRLLLTGTPLQNNLKELAALLGFILPSVFQERRGDLDFIFKAKAKTTGDDHSALLSAQRIARAKSMLTPFVLRRKKHQVLKHLPAKTCRVEYCDMTPTQREVYHSELQRARDAMEARAEGKKPTSETGNVLMQMRKAAIHPMLFRRLFDDQKIAKMARDCLGEEDLYDRDEKLVLEDMSFYSDFELHKFCVGHPKTMTKHDVSSDAWMDSGKVAKLVELLKGYRQNGDRALVFSQFTMVLDILQAVLDTIDMQYFRFDGSTKIDQRQDMIDQFYEEKDVTVFLLSTKAGGMGINLACANKVIIVDQSFNPQEDLQAENRAHRVGQLREVEVVRLITKGSVEEQIHALGAAKLMLDDRVAGDDETLAQEKKAAEAEALKVIEQVV